MLDATVGCCLVLWAAPWVLQPAQATLDLTTFRPPAQTRTRGWGAGAMKSGEDGSSNALVPFEVTVFLDKASYRVGDDLSFSLVLKSRSRETLVVPWQPDWRLVEEGHDRPPSGYAAAVLDLTIHVEGSPIVLFSQPIFGSRLAEGSLQSVSPGESVRITGRAKWDPEIVSPLMDESSGPQLTVGIGASFHILYPPDDRFLYLPSKSAELVSVQLHNEPH